MDAISAQQSKKRPLVLCSFMVKAGTIVQPVGLSEFMEGQQLIDDGNSISLLALPFRLQSGASGEKWWRRLTSFRFRKTERSDLDADHDSGTRSLTPWRRWWQRRTMERHLRDIGQYNPASLLRARLSSEGGKYEDGVVSAEAIEQLLINRMYDERFYYTASDRRRYPCNVLFVYFVTLAERYVDDALDLPPGDYQEKEPDYLVRADLILDDIVEHRPSLFTERFRESKKTDFSLSEFAKNLFRGHRLHRLQELLRRISRLENA